MIICADDFGLRADADEAILDLCEQGRLTAVSCMTGFVRCDSRLMKRLLEHQARVDIGLHLCLTGEKPSLEPSPRAFASDLPSFGVLLRHALFGQLRPDAVSNWIAGQYDLFVRKSGRRPDHIDGHLYVHQLPVVRRALLDFILALPPDERPYVRNTAAPLGKIRRAGLPWTKAAVIALFGTRMKKALQAKALPTNEELAGIYDFSDWRRYPEFFPKFAGCLSGPNGLLVTHPGRDEAWRESEFETLRQIPLSALRLNRFQRETVSAAC